jgi:hypothetical protein
MPKYSTEPIKKACKFPAISLRAYRAELVGEVARMEKAGQSSSSSPRFEEIMRTIDAINKLRYHHEGINACLCWHTDTELAELFRQDNYRKWQQEMAEQRKKGAR